MLQKYGLLNSSKITKTQNIKFKKKLNAEKSLVYNQIHKVQNYAQENEMKLNFSKTKFMLFNPTKIYDFIPELVLEGYELETVEQMRLLGLTVRNDLSWRSNTDEMTTKGYSRLWIIKRLKKLGASQDDLKDIYCKQVRSILEFGVPVWNSGITKEQSNDIERVQKAFLHIILEKMYTNYETALETIGLETLQQRRLKLCENFVKKAVKDPKHKHWFDEYNQCGPKTRSEKTKYITPLHRLERFHSSPIPYLTDILNNL